MFNLLKKAGLGVALAATALTTAAPAQAQYYDRYRRHDNGAGAAIVAGIAGLAIGAAIASSNRNDRYRGYSDDGYYRDGYNGYNYNRYNGYNGYNGYNNYDDRYSYQRCYTERRYDPYYNRSVRVRICR